MGQQGFLINTEDCIGCKACELACKDLHSFDIGPRTRRVYEVCGGDWSVDDVTGACVPSNVFACAVTFSCGHCDNPACVSVCPTGAHAKDQETGLVTVDAEVCIGCGSCVEACPYGAPQLVKDEGVVRKCDLCQGLREQGEEPACVALCPQRALKVGDIDELRAAYGTCADIQPLPSSEYTSPNIVVVPHRNARMKEDGSYRMLSLGQ